MIKIPTLFVREFKDHKVVGITEEVTPGCECVINGECEATVKYDGSCVAVINGEWYRRYDAKKGKSVPEGAIPCQDEPDPITGHWPHWVKIKSNNPGDKWYFAAFYNSILDEDNSYVTYEAVGPHFQGNPYGLDYDLVIKHGAVKIHAPITFEGLKSYLKYINAEGIVFWKDNSPVCKIKKSDFGYEWKHNINDHAILSLQKYFTKMNKLYDITIIK